VDAYLLLELERQESILRRFPPISRRVCDSSIAGIVLFICQRPKKQPTILSADSQDSYVITGCQVVFLSISVFCSVSISISYTVSSLFFYRQKRIISRSCLVKRFVELNANLFSFVPAVPSETQPPLYHRLIISPQYSPIGPARIYFVRMRIFLPRPAP